MKPSRLPLMFSARWWVPLVLVLFALLAMGLRYGYQMRTVEADVRAVESRRLLERLSVEQSRLDTQTEAGDTLLVRRTVSSLALHEGLDRAYLVDPQQRVKASLSRLDLGRSANEVLQTDPGQGAGLQALITGRPVRAIEFGGAGEAPLLTGLVPLRNGDLLGVRVDLRQSLALARLNVQTELAREGAVLGAAVLVLAVLLHLLWFRRAQALAGALGAMGEGRLSTRAALGGRDELALIGEAADRMAAQLQAGQERIGRMGDIINRSPLVVIEWRPAPGWPVGYVSESVAQWGYVAADFLDGQLSYNDLIHPDDVQTLNDEVAGYLANGPDEYRQSYRIRSADGRWVWLEDRTSLSRGADGTVLSISGILLDITPQKMAEQAQREQAELLRMFYELPFLGMAISSPTDKRWLQVNDRLCEILGYPREELLRMTWAEMTPPGDLERNVELFEELMAGQRQGYRMSKRFVRKDGRIVHTEIDVRAVRDEAGRVQQLFATIQDVTERKAAEDALQRSQAQLLKSQQIGRMGSSTQDLRRGLFTWSPQAYAIHEVDPQTSPLTLEFILALLHPDDVDRVDRFYGACEKSGETYDIRYRLQLPDGRIKHLRAKGEFEHEDGQPVRGVGMVLDETELVEAQRERDRLVSVMETTPDIVSMVDPQGRVFYFNRAGYDMLGLQPGQPLDGVIRQVHPPWAARLVQDEGIPAAMAEGRWLGETTIRTAQGDEVPMSQLIMSHRDPDGQIDYLWTILRDISERKTTEAALELERSRLAEAQKVARIGSWSVQLPEGRVSWSEHHYELLGLDPTRVTPSVEAYLGVVHPDDLPRVRTHVEHVPDHAQGLVTKIEHRIVTPQGVRHVEERASVERDADGRVVRLFGTTMDVTERVLAEQALREAKDTLEQGEAVGRLGSFAYDSDTRELKWSRQAFATIGLPFSLQPPSIDEYCACIHPDDVERMRASIELLVTGAEVPEVRFRTHPDRGPVRWLRRLFQRIDRAAEGLKPRYIGTLLDITDAVQAEERLREINQELEHRVAERTAQLSQANQELEAFSYTVSHDLKAPLRGIDGYSQLLVEEYGSRLDEDGLQFVRRIRQGVQQMGALISDLLEYSRMERRDMAVDPVALLPLVQQILDSHEADIDRHGVQVQLTMEPFTLALDREGIAVVLRNLIGNALKFSRGSLPPRIEIGTRSDGGRRLLWVRDNGVGFDMKYHDRMFGIFQRLHRAEEFPGTGVGLALVAKAVQRMGGRVWAESTLGAGATFYLEFPE